MKRLLIAGLSLLACCHCAMAATAPEAFIEHAAISTDGHTVWFSAHGDIWAAPRDGSAPARRLTDNVAYEDMPIPSPDGSMLAFQSNRFGSREVFVMPVEGGAATRLSWHSYHDNLLAWQPDGSGLLVSSIRDDWPAYALWAIPLDGAQPERLTGPDHDDHDFADWLGSDGSIIYTRGPGYKYRKRHHGSDAYDLWKFDAASRKHSVFVESTGQDCWPQVSHDGSTVYFVSDRDGTDNIYEIAATGGPARQLTRFEDDGPQFLRLSSDGDELVFTVFGSIYVMELASAETARISYSLETEAKHAELTEQSLRNQVEELAVSPDGKYFALVVNSDIHLLKNPDSYEDDAKPDQDLSRTIPLVTSPGRERQISWQHDGYSICYTSDRTGEYDIYMFDLATGEETQLTKTPLDESLPRCSPVDERILYLYGNHEMRVMEPGSTDSLLLSHAEHLVGPFGDNGYWSPDAAWVAFSVAPVWWSEEVYVVPGTGGERINLSMTPDNESGPVWSPDGRFLGFSFSSSDDYSNEYGQRARLLPLEQRERHYDPQLLFAEDLPEDKPLEAMDEKIEPTDDDAADDVAAAEDDAEKPAEEETIEPVKIDFDEIENRSRTIPPWGGNAEFRLFMPDGDVALISLDDGADSMLAAVDTESYDMEILGPDDMQDLQVTADGKRIYGLSRGTISYMELDGLSLRGQGSIDASSRVVVDKYALRQQSFLEMWRLLRDNFYDVEMHGTDWPAIRRKYEPLLASVPTGEEYTMLMNRMVGELAASHSWFFNSESSAEAAPQSTGSLGIELDETYPGPGWLVASVLRGSPAWQRGSELFPGDVILSVDGAAVGPQTQRERLFNDTPGELMLLEVQNGAPARDWLALQEDAQEEIPLTREVSIIPVSVGRLFGSKYEAWVRENRAIVDEQGKARIGYQHIESMGFRSLARFRRELYTLNHDREALIIDVRFNGGGDIYAQLYDIITNRKLFSSRTRFEQWRDTPEWQWQGPIVVLINAHSYSDAEDFAHMMQEQQLATIVGEDTGGNVIAVTGVGLADGSFFGMPIEGWYRLDGRNMEGFGCPADIYVHIDPNALAEGRDNQLEAAVSELLRQLGDDSGK